MGISEISPGEQAVVTSFDVDADKETITRFRALGLFIGAVVSVERHLSLGGPIVVRFGGGAFAIERSAATYIQVTRKVPSL